MTIFDIVLTWARDQFGKFCARKPRPQKPPEIFHHDHPSWYYDG